MDFKKLISKIDSIEAPQATPAAPKLPTPVQLNEDAELRVLAGTSTILAEAKKMKKDDMKKKGVKEEFEVDEEEQLTPPKKEKQEPVAEASDRPDAKKTATTWKDKSGKEHPATKVQGHASRKADKDAEKETKATMKKEGIEPEFKSKFMKMVEAKKKEKDEKKKTDKKMEEAKKSKMSKKDKMMDEGAKPDFLDLDKDGNKKEPMKSAAKAKGGEKKDNGKKGMSAAQAKYFGKKNESKVQLKKVVAESVETQMSFRDMMKLVVESGGQQQIDPLDKALFAWATRIAENKMGEGLKGQVYAGMVYERMGGRFEMYDVLAEDQK